MKTIRLAPLLVFFTVLIVSGARAQTITTRTLDYGGNGNVGQDASMAIVNGNPAIAYYNETDTSLMFARNSAADGSGVWQITTVRSIRDVGTFASLAVVNGNPAICYYENTFGTHGLKYVRALDADGTSWGTPIAVDSAIGTGWYTSLVIVNGNPAISYHDGSQLDLMYVRAGDANGDSWGTPQTLDSVGSVGHYSSLKVVDGNPAISYFDESNTNLKYIRATNASGTSWSAPVVVDGATSTVGRYSSLAVVDGNPAICYQDTTNTDLLYVRASDAGGTAWGVPVIVGNNTLASSSARYTSLAVINGRPAIAYYDSAFGSGLRYVRANDITGAAWGASLLLVSSGSVGIYPTLLVVAGNPAISCFKASSNDLMFLRAPDADGTAWPAPSVADDGTQSGLVGQHTSQAIVSGSPAISYFDETNDNLKFMRANGPDGSAWLTPVVVDSTGTVGQYTSLAVVDGNPAISYYDATNGNLKYARAGNAAGTVWNSPITVDSSAANVGQYTSLAVVDEFPAITYYDVTNGNLVFVRANDANGSTWSTPVPLDTTGNVGQYTGLEVVNGNPAISYYDVTNANLKYLRASDTSGTTWGAPVIVESAGNMGQYASLAVVNGNPAISHYDAGGLNLRFVRATDNNGAAWGTPVILDSTGSVGSHTSLAIVGGRPAISYYDATNDDLKYVHANDADGAAWGAPLIVDASGDVGSHGSMTVTNGNPAISYYDIDSGNLMWALITLASTDADGDGLPDFWELTYWGTTTGHDPLDDHDKDGYVELLELALGLNPTVSNPGGLPGVVDEGGYLTLTITKQAGVTYEVQSAGTLLPAQADSFSAGTTTVLINNSTTLKVRDNFLIDASPGRFMRVQVTAAP